MSTRQPMSFSITTSLRATSESGGVDQQQNETVSVNGSGFRFNNYALDGSDNMDPFFNTAAPFPNPDALQEFSVQTNNFSAESGRSAGAVVTAVTKSSSLIAWRA